MVDAPSIESRLERLWILLVELDEIGEGGRGAFDADYRGLFPELASAGLDQGLAARMGDAAGLRNILVHDYLELDEDVVWGALGHLDDLRGFAAFVLAKLDQAG